MADHATTSAGTWWWAMVRDEGRRPQRLVGVESTRYPDGTQVELTAGEVVEQVGDNEICTVEFAEDGHISGLVVPPTYAPKAPPIWFVEVPEPAARPEAVSLVAFTGADVATGALLPNLLGTTATSEDQIGALRWYPGSGEIDQIYVHPDWRRRNVASSLLVAGGMFSVARGWGRFWADGQRTALGEDLRNGRSWKKRASDLTHLHPPMTPGPDPDLM